MIRTWSLPCGQATLKLGTRTHIMGILNVTPDSFSDGGSYTETSAAISHALRMLEEGADIIDVGGESTRPGHVPVDAEEESRRVIPVIAALRRERPDVIISVDTYKAEVAEKAILAGANMINDVWGFLRDPALAGVAARFQVPAILMHNQDGTEYQDMMQEIITSLRHSIQVAVDAGLPADLTVLDPGIGFGKTASQNLDVLRDMDQLKVLGRPILLGTSRKSTIGKVLGGLPADERVEGTAATVAVGITRGADIVRVHDVRYMKRVAQMTDAIVRPGRGGFVSE